MVAEALQPEGSKIVNVTGMLCVSLDLIIGSWFFSGLASAKLCLQLEPAVNPAL